MSDKLKAWMVSIILHLGLLVFFAYMYFTVPVLHKPLPLEIYTFDEWPPQEEASLPVKSATNSEGTDDGGAMNYKAVQQSIALPQSNQDLTTPDIRVPRHQTRITIDKGIFNNEKISKESDLPEGVKQNIVSNKIGTGSGNATFSRSAGLGIGNTEGSSNGYTLEGSIKQRTVLYKQLPIFPKGKQINDSVTLRFDVSTDGYVSSISVTKKAEPEFEKACIKALKQWKFSSASNKSTGKITFVFELK